MGALTKVLFGVNLKCRNCQQSSNIQSQWWEKCGKYQGYIVMRCRKCDHGILLGAFAEKPFKPELFDKLGINLSQLKQNQAVQEQKRDDQVEEMAPEEELQPEAPVATIEKITEGKQWECPKCKRTLEETDKTCWSCGGKREDLLGSTGPKIKKTVKNLKDWECRFCKRTLDGKDRTCWSCGGKREDVEQL
jgi:hypothetical protein